MTKLAIRLLTLALFAVASFAISIAAPSKAAAETSKAMKKHKKMNPAHAQAPTVSSQYPRNMSDDPERKAGGGY